MQTDSLKETVADEKLHLFSIYADFAASVRVKGAINKITKSVGKHWQLPLEMWKLDLLTSESIKRMVADDAANADVLIVAVSSFEQRERELIQWLESLRAAPSDYPGLLIGMLGDEENRTQELDWMVNQLLRCARKMNRDFIWHWMEENADDCGWLVKSVEMLLARKNSFGLNEAAAATR
ncbi:MAG TPA: hypothetical protein VKI62_08715 [Bacteroidota bacterium]|nr:hypothetical protein [Bacteroidota bacterium]